jgi:hypothetical protein
LKRFSPTVTVALFVLLQPAGPAIADELLVSPLDGYYDLWLASVSHLMLEDERRAFEELGSDLQREIFIRRFWRARGDSGWLERWRENFDEARRRFGRLDEDRARAMLAAGKPATVLALRGCREVLRYLEVWSYEPWHAAYQAGKPGGGAAGEEGFHLLFYRDSNLEGGVYRHWSRHDGTAPLIYGGIREPWPAAQLVEYAAANGCLDHRGDGETLKAALAGALDAAELIARLAAPVPDPGWLAEIAAAPARASALPAAPAEIDFPGRYQQKTILHGRVRVPAREVARNAEGLLFDRLTILGDLRLGGAAGRLVDAFEVVHHVAGSEPRDGVVALDFYRRLPPGDYTLNLRAEDANGRGLLRESRALEVPRLSEPAEPPAGRWNGFAALTRSRVGVLTTFPSVELLAPEDDLPVGVVEVRAVVTGGPIDRVDFLLDGEGAGSDGEPPFAVELDLGREPRPGEAPPRTVAAVAFDPAGREIARDELVLVARARRFAVHLIEPRPGGPAGGGPRPRRALPQPGTVRDAPPAAVPTPPARGRGSERSCGLRPRGGASRERCFDRRRRRRLLRRPDGGDRRPADRALHHGPRPPRAAGRRA